MLRVLDPTTGRQLAREVTYPGGTGWHGITAAVAGIWLQTGTGMNDHLTFHSADHLGGWGTEVAEGNAGGGPVTSGVSGGVLWFSGVTALGCADPHTGDVRVSTRMPTGRFADLTDLTAVGGHVFASYQAGSGPRRLVRLTPPATCTG